MSTTSLRGRRRKGREEGSSGASALPPLNFSTPATQAGQQQPNNSTLVTSPFAAVVWGCPLPLGTEAHHWLWKQQITSHNNAPSPKKIQLAVFIEDQ